MDINLTNPVTAAKIGEVVNASASAIPNDTDLVMSVDTSVAKKNTWTQIKTFLKTYFDTIYQAAGTYLTSANITQVITNGVTDKAPSEDAVFDALALKQNIVAGVDDTEIGYLNGVTSDIQTQLDNRVTSILTDITDASHTGDTNNTIKFSFAIPANTFAVGNMGEYRVRTRKSGALGNLAVRVYLNTTNDLIGATLISTRTAASNSDNISIFDRVFFIKSSTVTEDILATTTSIPSASTATNIGVTNSNIDWTVLQYFIITLQLGNAGDTGIFSGAYLKRI